MREKISTRALWNNGAKYGALLGVFTIVCRLLAHGTSMLGTTSLSGILSFIIWVIQFAGCILLMRFILKKLSADFDDVTPRITFKYGMINALLSGLIFAAFNLAFYTVISPESIKEQIDLVYQLYGSQLDSNTRNALNQVEAVYPQISFITAWVYCFIYGTVLSAILSARPKDPFAADRQE